jgi:4-hydroxybenzoate polyprenyltransferase
VSRKLAISLSLVLAIISLFISALLSVYLLLTILIYAIIQILYCVSLKRIPVVDLFCISSGFLLRALSGAAASKILVSPWFLLTVGLLALFLAIEKRKAELRISCVEQGSTRSVLRRYSLSLLLRLESIVATSSFMSYSLWSAGPSLKGAPTSWMLITIPFVLLGIFRYQLLSDPDENDRRSSNYQGYTPEKPEEILLNDRGMQCIIAAWTVSVVLVGFIAHIRR